MAKKTEKIRKNYSEYSIELSENILKELKKILKELKRMA